MEHLELAITCKCGRLADEAATPEQCDTALNYIELALNKVAHVDNRRAIKTFKGAALARKEVLLSQVLLRQAV